jgi:hypothetical protein
MWGKRGKEQKAQVGLGVPSSAFPLLLSLYCILAASRFECRGPRRREARRDGLRHVRLREARDTSVLAVR